MLNFFSLYNFGLQHNSTTLSKIIPPDHKMSQLYLLWETKESRRYITAEARAVQAINYKATVLVKGTVALQARIGVYCMHITCCDHTPHTQTCQSKRQPLIRHERVRTAKETSCGLTRHIAKM